MGNLILWGFIILVLYIAYRKADKMVQMMDEVSGKQKMEQKDSDEDV